MNFIRRIFGRNPRGAALTVAVAAVGVVVVVWALNGRTGNDATPFTPSGSNQGPVYQNQNDAGTTDPGDLSSYNAWLSAHASELGSQAVQETDGAGNSPETAGTVNSPSVSGPPVSTEQPNPSKTIVTASGTLVVEPPQKPRGQYGTDSTPFSQLPENVASWTPVLEGFATNFTNTADGWSGRLQPFLSPSLYQSIQNVIPRTIPPNVALISAKAESYLEYSVVALLTYQQGFKVRVEIAYDGTNWLVATYSKAG